MKHRAIIFLDFDGVLNSLRSTLAFGGCGRHQFDTVALGLVRRLAVESSAGIVVSSAWRIGNSVADLKTILHEAGDTVLAGRVIDKTPQFGVNRGSEIAAWLATNPGEHDGNFVILDDDGDMLDGQLSRFVQCRHRDGFGVPEYLRALRVVAPDHADVVQLAWYETDRPLSSEVREKFRRLEWDATQ